MIILQSFLILPLLLLACYAAISDIRSFIIPNWISVAMVATFFPAFFMAGLPIAELLHFVLPAFIAFAICFGLFCMNLIGGGDAKLLPACALWIGKAHILHFIIATSIAGGILCFALFAFWLVKRSVPALSYLAPMMSMERPKYVPYGVAIAAGTLMVFPFTPLFKALWLIG